MRECTRSLAGPRSVCFLSGEVDVIGGGRSGLTGSNTVRGADPHLTGQKQFTTHLHLTGALIYTLVLLRHVMHPRLNGI